LDIGVPVIDGGVDGVPSGSTLGSDLTLVKLNRYPLQRQTLS
jgi:hypothetical protein